MKNFTLQSFTKISSLIVLIFFTATSVMAQQQDKSAKTIKTVIENFAYPDGTLSNKGGDENGWFGPWYPASSGNTNVSNGTMIHTGADEGMYDRELADFWDEDDDEIYIALNYKADAIKFQWGGFQLFNSSEQMIFYIGKIWPADTHGMQTDFYDPRTHLEAISDVPSDEWATYLIKIQRFADADRDTAYLWLNPTKEVPSIDDITTKIAIVAEDFVRVRIAGNNNWQMEFFYMSNDVDAILDLLFDETSAGRPEFVSNPALNVFPNPARNIAFAEFNLEKESRVQLNVYDLSGKLVQKIADERYPTGLNKVQYSVSELSNGMYITEMVIDNNNAIRQKLVVTK